MSEESTFKLPRLIKLTGRVAEGICWLMSRNEWEQVWWGELKFCIIDVMRTHFKVDGFL